MSEALLGAHGNHQKQTQAYYVQINSLDKHSTGDPTDPNFSQGNSSFPTFKESHPSLYMPMHNYARYKMQDAGKIKGLDIIKEKGPKQYAIQKLLANNPKGTSNARELLNKSLEIQSSTRQMNHFESYGASSNHEVTLDIHTEADEVMTGLNETLQLGEKDSKAISVGSRQGGRTRNEEDSSKFNTINATPDDYGGGFQLK